jgi:hypothetical protein
VVLLVRLNRAWVAEGVFSLWRSDLDIEAHVAVVASSRGFLQTVCGGHVNRGR